MTKAAPAGNAAGEVIPVCGVIKSGAKRFEARVEEANGCHAFRGGTGPAILPGGVARSSLDHGIYKL